MVSARPRPFRSGLDGTIHHRARISDAGKLSWSDWQPVPDAKAAGVTRAFVC